MEAVKEMQFRRHNLLPGPARGGQRPIRLVMEAEKDMQYLPSQPELLGSKLQSTSQQFVTTQITKDDPGRISVRYMSALWYLVGVRRPVKSSGRRAGRMTVS
jgi:hypothetical protein